MFQVEMFLEDLGTIQSKIKIVKSVDVYKEDRRFGEETEKVRDKFGESLEQSRGKKLNDIQNASKFTT